MTAEYDDSITRVFVSGLPPTFTSEQLRAHFAKKFSVNDAHVLSGRRIGFVGFPDHESAKEAASYFNRSFVRMSKISVDLAEPVEFKRDENGQTIPVSHRSAHDQGRNKSREALLPSEKPNKRKRAVQDDGEAFRAQSNPTSENPPQANGSTPERIALHKNTEVTERTIETTKDESQEDIAMPDAVAGAEPSAVNVEHSAPTSDSDWLRGKTSRLLDLVDPEERVEAIHAADRAVSSGNLHDDNPLSEHADENLNYSTVPFGDRTKDGYQINVPNARLFVRNLPFSVSKADLMKTFSTFGKVEEVHLVKDSKTSVGRGLGFVQFLEPEAAENALRDLDGKVFQGRLMHILPASDKKDQKLTDYEISKLPLKKQKVIKRKTEAATASFSWNSLYMNPDAILASVADRLGVAKSDIIDASSSDAAVKQAHAETSVIQETKNYLRSNGVDVDAFKRRPRDDRTVLLKNFPYGTTSEELLTLLSTYGSVQKFILPPTGTMAIAQFDENDSASQALKGLAYRNIKGSVLYLEKAPEGIFSGHDSVTKPAIKNSESHDGKQSAAEQTCTGTTSSTVFIRNLNFSTSSTRLAEVFKPLSGFLSARVKTRTDAKRPQDILSMGFGFAEFRTHSQAEAAVATMNGHRLDGHEIIVQPSRKAVDVAEERRRDELLKRGTNEKTKIIIKNLPFEASKKDIRSLFGTYGQLRSVRMPKKFDSSTRGFAFADFVTAKEAENAMDALSNTHLLGRRLILDFAESDVVDPEDVIKAMEKKAGQQVHLTAVNKMMTGSTRKKFNVDLRDDGEIA